VSHICYKTHLSFIIRFIFHCQVIPSVPILCRNTRKSLLCTEKGLKYSKMFFVQLTMNSIHYNLAVEEQYLASFSAFKSLFKLFIDCLWHIIFVN